MAIRTATFEDKFLFTKGMLNARTRKLKLGFYFKNIWNLNVGGGLQH